MDSNASSGATSDQVAFLLAVRPIATAGMEVSSWIEGKSKAPDWEAAGCR